MPKIGLRNVEDSDILAGALESVWGTEFSSVEIGVTCNDLEKKAHIRRLLENYFSSSLGKKIQKENFEVYFLFNYERGVMEAIPSSVCIEGRYNKFSREIAQTFHYCYKCKGRGCDFCQFRGKLSELSVQELLDKKILPAFGSAMSKFHGCGREDVDVLMLGKGRPFVFEALFAPKRSADLAALEKEINSEFEGKIAVHSLKFCGQKRIVELKNTQFGKVYRAKCSCDENVSQKELDAFPKNELPLVQRTPERVELRRADKEREKGAKIMGAKKLSEKKFEVDVLSSHGLYVKEFVSGDSGRTIPSISSLLGKNCKCVRLDVLEIVLEK